MLHFIVVGLTRALKKIWIPVTKRHIPANVVYGRALVHHLFAFYRRAE